MMIALLLPFLCLQTEAPAPTLAGKAESLAEQYVAAERVMGLSVGVIAPGGESFTFGVGQFSRADERVPDERTLYEIGSVTKVLTGVLLADSVARGEVQLDDTVQSFLPEGVELAAHRKGPIRLVHLTTHSSGLPRMPKNFDLSFTSEAWSSYGADDMYEFLSEFRPKREPGRRYAYSNLAAGLLGHVLERNAGVSYETLLRERLCVPLGMADTRIRLEEEQLARFAPGHDANLDEAEAWEMGVLAPCGGVRSSVADMLLFLRANLSGDSSLDEQLALARTVHSKHKGSNAPVGLGWHVAGDGSTRIHSGQTGGYHSYIAVNTKLDVAVIVLANTTSAHVDGLGNSLVNLALGVTLPGPDFKPIVELKAAQLERFVGRYVAPDQLAVELSRKENRLYAQVEGPGQSLFRILPLSETAFEYAELKATIDFELAEGGDVNGLVFRQNGLEFHCKPETK